MAEKKGGKKARGRITIYHSPFGSPHLRYLIRSFSPDRGARCVVKRRTRPYFLFHDPRRRGRFLVNKEEPEDTLPRQE